MATKAKVDLTGFRKEAGVYPEGKFEAYSNDEGVAYVIEASTGKVAKRYRGESAWSDAARIAGDLNARAKYEGDDE